MSSASSPSTLWSPSIPPNERALSYTIGDGKYVGFHTEMAENISADIAKQLGISNLKINKQLVTSQNRIPLVVNGTIDLECGSTTNNSTRAKDVSFAINHFYTGTRLLTKVNSGIKNYADLAGKPVVSTSGTTNVQVIRKYDAEKNLNDVR